MPAPVHRLLAGSALGVLRRPLYRRWALADLVSSTGTWLQVVGAHVFVLLHTGSATRVGVTVLLTAVPAIVAAPFAGAVIDRLPARRVLLTVQSLQAALSFGAAVVIAGGAGVLEVQAIAMCGGLLAVASGPATARFAASVVDADDLPRAIACGSVTNSLGRIIGTALAGVLAAAIGVPGLYLLDAASFLVVVATVASLREHHLRPLPQAERHASGVRAGLRYIRTRRHLVITLGLSLVLGSIGRNFQVAMAALTKDAADTAATYGLMSSLFAVGALGGALIGSALPKVRMPVMLAAAGAAACVQALSGLTPHLRLVFVALVLIAIGAVITDTGITTVMQSGSSPMMRGRVVAAHGMVSALAGGIGAPLVGWMSEHLGVRVALGLNGTAVLVACLLAAVLLRSPRHRLATWRRGGSGPVVPCSLRRVPPAATCSVPSPRSAAIPLASSSVRGGPTGLSCSSPFPSPRPTSSAPSREPAMSSSATPGPTASARCSTPPSPW